MPAHVRLRVDPSPSKIAGVFRQLALDLVDFRPAWSAMVPGIANGLGALIRSGGASGGAAWPPLSIGYEKRKRRLGKGRALLVLTGDLLRTVSDGTAGVRLLTSDELQFGPTKRYAFILHHGEKKGRGGLPARPFIFWTDGMRSKADAVLRGFLDQRIERARGAIAGAR